MNNPLRYNIVTPDGVVATCGDIALAVLVASNAPGAVIIDTQTDVAL